MFEKVVIDVDNQIGIKRSEVLDALDGCMSISYNLKKGKVCITASQEKIKQLKRSGIVTKSMCLTTVGKICNIKINRLYELR